MSEPPSASKHNDASAPAQTPRRRRWLRRALLAAAVVVVLLLLLVLLLPTLLGTGVGRGVVASWVNRNLAGRVQFDGLSLAWGRGQSVTGLKLYDPSGKIVLAVDRIEMPDASLRRLLFGNKDVGLIRVVKPDLTIIQTAGGETNVAKTLPPGSAPANRTAPQPSSPSQQPTGPQPPQPSPPPQPTGVPTDLKVKFEVVDAHATCSAPGMEPAEVKDLSFTADATSLQNIHVAMKSTVRQGNQGGMIDADFTVTNLIDGSGLVQVERATVEGTASVAGLPVVVVDRIGGMNGELLALLGPTLEATIRVAGNLEKLDATIHGKSLHLTADTRVTVSDHVLTVIEPTRLELNVTPQAWRTLAGGNSSGTLVNPFLVAVHLDSLRLPFKGAAADHSIDLMAASASGGLSVGEIVMDVPNVGRVVLRDTHATISSERLGKAIEAQVHTVAQKGGAKPGTVDLWARVQNAISPKGEFDLSAATATINGSIAELPLVVVDQIGATDGLLEEALGPILNATLDGSVEPGKSGGVTGYLNLTATAANLDARVHGPIAADRIQFDAGSTVSLTISQSLASRCLGKPDEAQVSLTKPAQIQASFTTLMVPMREGKPDVMAATIDAAAKIPLLAANTMRGPVALHNAALSITAKPLSAGMRVGLKGSIEQNGAAENVDLALAVTPPKPHATTFADYRRAAFTLSGQILDAPIAEIDQMLAQNGRLAAILGDKVEKIDLNLSLDTGGGKDASMPFSGTVTTPQLKVNFAGRYGSGPVLTLDGGSSVDIIVTPASWAAWSGAGPQRLVLAEPMRLSMKTDGLRLAWSSGAINLPASSVNVTVTTSAAAFQNPATAQGITLKDLSLAVESANLADHVHVTGRSGFIVTGATVPGTLTTDTDVRGLSLKNGAVSLDHASLWTATHAKAIPVAVLDAVLRQGGQLVEMIGPTAALDLAAGHTSDKPSDLDLSLTGDNADIRIAGTLDQNMGLTLRKDATAQLRVTPKLSKYYLAKLSPLLREAQSSKDPIRLKISKDGFSVKAYPYDPDTLNGDFQLDIGTLVMRQSDGAMTQALKFLTRYVTTIESRDEFPATFTTLTVQARNGRLTTNDLWLTTDRHDLTMGAKAVVYRHAEDKAWHAEMVMGIGADTFANVRGIGSAIDRDAVFEIPVSGPLDALKLDFVTATTRLAPMLVKSIKGAGEIGDIIGQGTSLIEGALAKNKDKNKGGFVSAGWPNKPSLPAPAPGADRPAQPTEQPRPTQNDADAKKPLLPGGLDDLIPGLVGGEGDKKPADSPAPAKKKGEKKKK